MRSIAWDILAENQISLDLWELRLSHFGQKLWYLTILMKIWWISNLDVSCHYLKSGQSACMFCISHGIQCRQDRRYIAESTTGDQGAGNDDITTFYGRRILHISYNFESILLLQINRNLYDGYSGALISGWTKTQVWQIRDYPPRWILWYLNERLF